MGMSISGGREETTLLATDDMRAAARRVREEGAQARDDAEEPRARAVDPAAQRRNRMVPEPEPLQSHGPARVVALCNQKGGVGKTTSTINLGAALTEYGRRVLLVDFDPQGALSVGLGVQPHQLDRTIYDVLMESSVTIDDCHIGIPSPVFSSM